MGEKSTPKSVVTKKKKKKTFLRCVFAVGKFLNTVHLDSVHGHVNALVT